MMSSTARGAVTGLAVKLLSLGLGQYEAAFGSGATRAECSGARSVGAGLAWFVEGFDANALKEARDR
jgi:hypothetical protein